MEKAEIKEKERLKEEARKVRTRSVDCLNNSFAL